VNNTSPQKQKPIKFKPESIAANFEHYRLGAPARYFNDLRAREAQGNFNRANALSEYLKKAYSDF